MLKLIITDNKILFKALTIIFLKIFFRIILKIKISKLSKKMKLLII